MAHDDDGGGDAHPALHALMAQLQVDLREIAARQLAGERAGHTLQPTALVNEAYLRLHGQQNVIGMSRTAFLAAAAQTIRRILVDHARARQAGKRGGGVTDGGRVTLSGLDVPAGAPSDELDVLALHDAMTKLQGLNERVAKVVEQRYFGGMTVTEVADSLGVSERTVAEDWAFARSWLRRELGA